MSSIPTASFSKWSDTGALSTATPRCGEGDQLSSFLNQITDTEAHRIDDPVNRRHHRMLHLHRFDDHQGLATLHRIAHLHQHLGDPSRHRSGQTPRSRIIAFIRCERVDLDQPPVLTGENYCGFRTVIEHRSVAAYTIEHNSQGAVGPTFAEGADPLFADLQQPFFCS